MVKKENISEMIQHTVEDNALPELIDQIWKQGNHGQNSEFPVNNEAIENSVLNLSKCDFCGMMFSSSETLKNHVYFDHHHQKLSQPAQYLEAHRNTVHDDFKKSFYAGMHYTQWAKI